MTFGASQPDCQVSVVPDYVPTAKDRLRSMDKLAQDAVRAACRDARLAGQIEMLNGVPISTLNQDVCKAALLKVFEIATTDEAERVYENKETGEVKVVTIANPRQLQALEILLEHRIREGELLLKAQGLSDGKPEVTARVIMMTPDDVKRLSEMERQAK